MRNGQAAVRLVCPFRINMDMLIIVDMLTQATDVKNVLNGTSIATRLVMVLTQVTTNLNTRELQEVLSAVTSNLVEWDTTKTSIYAGSRAGEFVFQDNRYQIEEFYEQLTRLVKM